MLYACLDALAKVGVADKSYIVAFIIASVLYIMFMTN